MRSPAWPGTVRGVAAAGAAGPDAVLADPGLAGRRGRGAIGAAILAGSVALLGSAATAGEGTQNLLCAWLAIAVLTGLIANTLLGAWWLDGAVALAFPMGGPRRPPRLGQAIMLVHPVLTGNRPAPGGRAGGLRHGERRFRAKPA
jgi:hypothetical protein